MVIEGYDAKLNENLTFRLSNENDKDINGSPVPANVFVFIKLSDCKTFESDGKLYYDTDSAPAIPILYIDTYYGMGEFKTRKTVKGIKLNQEIVYEYKQSTMYFAHNGMVYTASIQNTING